MKIDVSEIVSAHLLTLVDARSGKASFTDSAVFFLFPLILSCALAYSTFRITDQFYSLSISVFAIFAALLFSAQIGLFSILQRDNRPIENGSSKVESALRARARDRKALLREVNANISYLILVSLISVTLLLTSALVTGYQQFKTFVFTFLMSHFVLTVLLVVSRIHTLFDKEYE